MLEGAGDARALLQFEGSDMRTELQIEKKHMLLGFLWTSDILI